MARKAPSPEIVQPAHLWVPEHASTAGAEVADLMELAGKTPDLEQRLALDALLAEQPDGRWAAIEGAVIAARQNLKTFLFKAVVLGDLYLFDTDYVVWTAHEFSTAMEAFRDVKELVTGTPYFSRRIKKIIEANGDEGIEFHSGQRLRFRARTKTGGRGLTGDRVILDEAFALQPSHMGSLMPTLSAKSVTGNPSILYGSSAGLVSSSILRGIRERGRAGGDPSLTYIEWCAPEGGCAEEECDHRRDAESCALDDVENWRKANPALGRRISVAFVAAERRTLPVEEFARERLGWWEDPIDGEEGMPLADWDECGSTDHAPADPLVLAVDVAPDHLWSSIAACGGAVEILARKRGSSWLVDELKRLVDEHHPLAVGLDPAGPVGSLIPDLEDAGFKIRGKEHPDGLLVLLEGKDAVRACGSLYTAVLEHTLQHRDQPIVNDAFAGAIRRQVGDAWKWSRRDSSVDISSLVAITVARWVHLTLDAKPARPASGKPAKATTTESIFRPRGRLKL